MKPEFLTDFVKCEKIITKLFQILSNYNKNCEFLTEILKPHLMTYLYKNPLLCHEIIKNIKEVLEDGDKSK